MWTMGLFFATSAYLPYASGSPNWCMSIYVRCVMPCMQAWITLHAPARPWRLSLMSTDLSSQSDQLAKQVVSSSSSCNLLQPCKHAELSCDAFSPGGGWLSRSESSLFLFFIFTLFFSTYPMSLRYELTNYYSAERIYCEAWIRPLLRSAVSSALHLSRALSERHRSGIYSQRYINSSSQT